METRIATSIEQSKKLIELGIDVNTADIHYVRQKTDFMGKPVDGKWSEPKYGNTNSKYAHYVVQNFSSYETLPAWSKEDEMIALSIEQVMNCASLLNIVPEKIDKIRTWLKSLKSRCTWKPSEEQMDALEHFVRSIGESGYASPYDANLKLVHSLLNDLKKLKEVDKNCKKKGGEE